MNWIFNLINKSGTSATVEEPIGWDGHQFSLNRNQQHHGIFQSLETGSLQWIDSAFTILNNEYIAEGANGFMELRVRYQCEGEAAVEYYRGKFDFNTFKRECGDTCYVECQVLATTCANTFLSRMGQKIDIDTRENFDGDSISGVSTDTMTIEGQTIFMHNEAFNNGSTLTSTFIFVSTGNRALYIPIQMPTILLREFGTFNPNGAANQIVIKGNGETIVTLGPVIDQDDWRQYGQFLTIWERTSDPLNCIDNDAAVGYELSGTLSYQANYDTNNFAPQLILAKYNSIDLSFTVIYQDDIGPIRNINSGVLDTFTFNITRAPNTIAYAEADNLMWFVAVPFTQVTGVPLPGFVTGSIQLDLTATSKFTMDLDSDCDPTQAKVVKLPDLLEFFPKVYMAATCPQVTIQTDLRTCLNQYYITNGLFIREVTEPNLPSLFISYEWLFANINKIFNIGWGFDNNETDIIIGNLERFYQTSVSVNVGVVDKATFTTALDLIYGSMTIGYNKWEAEEYNGLDETNTKREYRRNIDSSSKEADIVSNIISAGYTIEVTRRKNQAKTGTQDTPYDNDIFIIDGFIQDGQLYAYRGTSDASNIYRPAERMNLRLTPLRNLMRWWKTIASPRPIITNEEHIFTASDGNYNAACRFNETCDPSDDVIVAENQTVISTDVKIFEPLWIAMYCEFNVPLSMSQFELIKANIYNAIAFTCGGVRYNGSIINMGFDPIRGMADFKLLLLRS